MIICAGLLIVSFAIVLVRFCTKQILVDKFHLENTFVRIVFNDNPQLMKYPWAGSGNPGLKSTGKQKNTAQPQKDVKKKNLPYGEMWIDWDKLYPFPKKKSKTIQRYTLKPSATTVKAVQNKPILSTKSIKDLEDTLDSWTNKNFYHYMSIVNLSNKYQRFIKWNISLINAYNNVVELPDGQWVGFNRKRDVSVFSSAVINFSSFCQEHHINFLMVLAPSKIARSEKAAFASLDFSNQNGDDFIRQLEEAGVNCIDLRDNIEKEGFNQHDLFYRTDHHWKVSTARWASGVILEQLNKKYHYTADLSLLSPDNYTEKTYPSLYLGSRGKKVTVARAKPDDFTLYQPKFASKFHISVPSMHVDKDGDFSVLYNFKMLTPNKGGYTVNAYQSNAYGDRPLVNVQNKMINNDTHTLLIRDSFGNALIPFLSLGINKLSSLDLRHFTGSLKTYIAKNKPDTIILLYYIEELNNTRINWTTHTDLFDFR